MFEGWLIAFFGAVFFLVAWRWIDWAIVLAIIFSPAYLLRFKVWSVPTTILELMLIIIFFVWLTKLFFPLTNWRKNFKQVKWPWKWLTLFFILVGIVSVLISPDIRQALGLWKAYILEPVLFFIVFVNVIKTKKQVRQVVWALGASVVLVGFGTMLQYLGIMSIPGNYGLEIPLRATSFFPFPTAVGKYCGPLLGFFIGFLAVEGLKKGVDLWQKVKNNIFVVGVIIFGLIGLMFSFSRAAMVGVLFSLILTSFFSRWKKKIWAVIMFLVFSAMLVPAIRYNIIGVLKRSDVSTDVHIVMWKGAARIIKDNLVTGTGLASFPVIYGKYKEASHTEYFPNPDNLVLTLWIELGLAGLVVFFWIVISYFKSAASLIVYSPAHAVGLMAAMTALIVHGFFDTPYFKNDLAVIFWALAGILVVLEGLKFHHRFGNN